MKLGVLVREQWEVPASSLVPGTTVNGATLLEAFPSGRAGQAGQAVRGWVLIDDGSVSAFGGALAWALRSGVDSLHILVEGEPAGGGRSGEGRSGAGRSVAGIVARRAQGISPAPTIWLVSGRTLRVAAPASPTPTLPLPDDVTPLLDVFRAHGIDPVVEHGTAVGEVLGLEVARVVVDQGGAHIEVGVGRHDREARSELRPGEPLGAALDDVVALVRQWRTLGAGRHPANTLGRERWLRSVVLGRPDLVGARRLDPVPSVLPRDDLRRSAPAASVGIDGDGSALVVVCSTGVDLDLVPTAADYRMRDARDAAVKLVVPEGDDYPVTRDLARMLVGGAEVVTVPRGWAGLLGPTPVAP